ncbi:Peptidoglycan-associated lipoprotein [subsurface metagenome]
MDVKISPGIFSPDGDGENDILFIRPEISDLTPILNWNAMIYTKNGSIFKSFSGIRMPCEELMWDGVSDAGRLVDSAEDYYLVFEATDSGLNTGISEKILFSIDILVIPTERGLKIQVSNIEFRFDTADLQGEKTFAILRRGAEVLEKYSKYSIIIEGHTDSTGDEDYNLTLSQKRAESVGQFLIQNGIDVERLSYEGYGSQYPIDTNRTPEGRARNRRVEFILIREK